MSAATTQTYELFVRTTPEKLWQAITEGALTQQYFFGTALQAELRPGGSYSYAFPDGSAAVSGEIAEVSAPNRLVMSWKVHYDPSCAGETSRVTWLVEGRGAASKLTLTHDLAGAPATAKNVGLDGWSVVLSSLKTLLETGAPLLVGAAA